MSAPSTATSLATGTTDRTLSPTPALATGQASLTATRVTDVPLVPKAVTTPLPSPTMSESDIISRAIRGVVQIQTDSSSGTGFLVQQRDQDTLILTNAHVIVGAQAVSVVTSDGSHHQANVLARDEDVDLALLAVKDIAGASPLAFGDAEKLRPGDPLYVIGYPLGTQLTGDSSVARGVFSARRTLNGSDYIQTNIAMNPGNSGGPVLNAAGEVVGVATMKLANAEGINFAIPSNRASAEVNKLIAATQQGGTQVGDTWKVIAPPSVLRTTEDVSKLGIYEQVSRQGSLWENHAVWMGHEMFVWGEGGAGRYDPETDSWRSVSLTGAPRGRNGVLMVWTGKEVIVWSGDSGGRYDPVTDTWMPVSVAGARQTSYGGTAVWTGKEMICPNTGTAYNPTTDTWRSLPAEGAPSGRTGFTAVWTGKEMIVWGGMAITLDTTLNGAYFLNDGARYNPDTDRWSPISKAGAPAPRDNPVAVWTGKEMIVVGGQVAPSKNPTFYNDGGRYDPSTDSWSPVPATDLLPRTPYLLHLSAIWTGHEAVFWGGYFDSKNYAYLNGSYNRPIQARFNPQSNLWSPLPEVDALQRAVGDDLVWTGKEMIVFGWFQSPGKSDPKVIAYSFTGARYTPPEHLRAEGVANDAGSAASEGESPVAQTPTPIGAMAEGPSSSTSGPSQGTTPLEPGANPADTPATASTTRPVVSPVVGAPLLQNGLIGKFKGQALVAPDGLQPFADLGISQVGPSTSDARDPTTYYLVAYYDPDGAGITIEGFYRPDNPGLDRIFKELMWADCAPKAAYCTDAPMADGRVTSELFRGLQVGAAPAEVTHITCCNGLYWTVYWWDSSSSTAYQMTIAQEPARRFGESIGANNTSGARQVAGLAAQLTPYGGSR